MSISAALNQPFEHDGTNTWGINQNSSDEGIGPFTEDCICLNPVEKDPTLWRELADAAIHHYNIDNNKTRDAKLTVSGAVKASVLFFANMAGFHLSFQAQDNLDSSPKTVFAEVFWSKWANVVTFCGVMDPSITPELLKICNRCSRKMLHPNMDFFKKPPMSAFAEDAASVRRHPLHYVWSRLGSLGTVKHE